MSFQDWRAQGCRPSAPNRLLQNGILFSEALAAEDTLVFEGLLARPGRHCDEAGWQLLSLRQKPQLTEGQEPGFCQDVTA